MSLIKCPKCGEMFSDSYKTCPFCEEDEAYYSGKVRKHCLLYTSDAADE